MDFDQWCRFKFGDKILILVALDADGQGVLATTIYRIADYVPETTTAVTQATIAYGQMMSEFGQGMLDVLSYYPLQRSVDISSVGATKSLFEGAYLGPPTNSHFRTAGETYGQQMRQIAQDIQNENFRGWVLYAVDWIEYVFVTEGDDFNAGHFQYLFAESDPVQNFYDNYLEVQDHFNAFPVTIQRQILPHGVSVTFDVYHREEHIAHFTMTASPPSPLSVQGTIGTHIIVWNDYNPYFIKIFARLFEAGYYPWIG